MMAYEVAEAFKPYWVFKYGPTKMPLSDNGLQFVVLYLEKVFLVLGVKKVFKTMYHPN